MAENVQKKTDLPLAPLNENPEANQPKITSDEDYFARLDGKEPDRLKTDQFARPQLVGGPRDRNKTVTGPLQRILRLVPWVAVLVAGVWLGRWSVSRFPDEKNVATKSEKAPVANQGARYWNPKNKKK